MKEVWKDIPGYPNYQASSLGRIRSKDRLRPLGKVKNKFQRVPGKILKQNFRSSKYNVVAIYDDRGIRSQKNVRVHVLILETFVGPRPKNMQGAHLNGNCQDNRLENLIWATREENERHKAIHGRVPRGDNHHWTKYSDKTVSEMKRLRSLGWMYKDIAAKLNISSAKYAQEICSGRKRAKAI